MKNTRQEQYANYLNWLKTTETCPTCHQPKGKMHADHGIRKNIGSIIDDVTELIRLDADTDSLADYLEDHFFFGAWSEISNVMPPDFLANCMGLILDACQKRVAEERKNQPMEAEIL